jgi:UDP:flavonoid glycosyltransferase YjiC (YdhE family)
MSGLLNAVPQINFPGFIFERRFNAMNVQKSGCGVFCEKDDFTPIMLKKIVKDILNNPNYLIDIHKMKEKLLSYGGTTKVIRDMEGS